MPLVDAHILDDQGGQQIGVRTDGKSPTLRAEMHGNVPCVMQSAGLIPYTLKIRSGCEGGGKGALIQEDLSATLATNNDQYLFRPVVCYAMQAIGEYKESDTASSMKARDYKDATDLVCECAGVDCRNATEYPELNGTLQAKGGGGFCLNCNQVVRVRYIVRRLTPTECARLQGFADRWGDIDPKEKFTDAEWCFWQDVRNTHAALNGRPVKSYTKAQMLSWYNKLHTDSAEYKMWGNGIALPPAMYCMQGMEAALRNAGDDSWLL